MVSQAFCLRSPASAYINDQVSIFSWHLPAAYLSISAKKISICNLLQVIALTSDWAEE